MKNNVVADKSIAFAIRIIGVYKFLSIELHEYVLSKQLLRSGTAIGALIREAEHGQSKADFLSKMNIALKEANESDYWLLLLKEGSYLTESQYQSVQTDCSELIKLLASIVKSTKISLGR